jgi:hypothetical protein
MISSLFNQAFGICFALKAFRNEHGTLTQPTPALATVTATSVTLSGGEVPFLSRCTKPKASGFHLGKPARRERTRNKCNRSPVMFSRYLAATALSIAVIAGVRSYLSAIDPPRHTQAIPEAEMPANMGQAERERFEDLRDVARRRGEYAKFAEALTLELERGTIGLREATERIFYFCIQNYPEHLDHAGFAEEGLNIKTKIARNLVRTPGPISAIPAAAARTEDVTARLERELRELPYEEESGAPLERN